MITDYQPHTKLIQRKVELSANFIEQAQIVNYEVMQYNSLVTPSVADMQRLECIVNDFNYHQKYLSVRGSYSSPDELLKTWIDKRTVAQIKISTHTSNKKKAISFYTTNLSFDDFYKAHRQTFPKYSELLDVLSFFCRKLYTYIESATGTSPFFQYQIYTYNHKCNPYSESFVNKNWKLLLSDEDIQNKKKLKTIFATIANTFFVETQFQRLPGFATNWLLFIIAQGKPISYVVQTFLELSYLAANKLLSTDIFSTNTSPSPKTRLINWCEFEKNRKCTKLKIDCHSSVNCPFYRESQLKKQQKN